MKDISNSSYEGVENLNDFQDAAPEYSTAYYFSFIIFSLITENIVFLMKNQIIKNKSKIRMAGREKSNLFSIAT